VKVYSTVLLLSALVNFTLLAVRGAVINDTPQGACVVARVLRRTPYAGDAELAAATFVVVVWAIHPPPGVAAADLDAPALRFSMRESLHVRIGKIRCSVS
jgi:hypothetical protein